MARLRLEDVQPLLEAPSPAALAIHRADGSVHLSPVWYRWTADHAFEVVIAPGDGKLTHLATDRRVSLLIFEAVRPFRGVEVRGVADLRTDGVADARLAIASRYLGTAGGQALTKLRGDRGVVLSLRPANPRVWDLSEVSDPS